MDFNPSWIRLYPYGTYTILKVDAWVVIHSGSYVSFHITLDMEKERH